MKALIFENKVIDVQEVEFQVSKSLTWMDCPDNCKAGSWELVSGSLQEIPEVEVLYNEKRSRAYPSIGDQLDMQYHDELNGTTTWKDAVAKVKADNPK